MAHYGNLETHEVGDDIRDIRGAIVRGSDGKELGTVDDVVFDHDTVEIEYVVLDSMEAGTVLLPADRVSLDTNHEDGLATGVTRQQIRKCSPIRQQITQFRRGMEEIREGVGEVLGRAARSAHERHLPDYHSPRTAGAGSGEFARRRQPTISRHRSKCR